MKNKINVPIKSKDLISALDKALGLEKCPIDQKPVTKIGPEKYECQHCKRVWNCNEFGEVWSDVRRVQFLKPPEEGNNYNDVIKPVD